MTLQDLGNLGELIGAIAVVISFVFLAVQIRQNTKTVQTSTYQAVLDSARSDTELILAHPHLERIYRLGRRDLNDLTDDERPLFRMLVAQILLNHELLFLQHQRGVIDAEFWRGRQEGLRALLSQPGVRKWWKEAPLVHRYYVTGFRQLVDSILDELTDRDESQT